MSRLRQWVLLDAHRWTVAAGLSAVTFLALLILAALDPYELSRTIATNNTLALVFQGFLGAIVTGVTLVVTINQLVLSQELGPVGDQRERMEAAMTFQHDIEDDLDLGVSPADPASFLAALADTTAERAAALGDVVDGHGETGMARDVADYVDEVAGSARAVSRQLADAQFGTFEVVAAALELNYSRQIHEARRLRAEYAAELGPEAGARLGDLLDALTWFGPTREHVKTLYFQWELVDLSRTILYAAVPALVVVLGMLLFGADGRSIPGRTLGLSNLLWASVAASTVGLAPFMILISYVFRLGTVAKRTLAIGPFELQELDSDGGGHQ